MKRFHVVARAKVMAYEDLEQKLSNSFAEWMARRTFATPRMRSASLVIILMSDLGLLMVE